MLKHKQKTNDQLLPAVLFLTALVVFAIASGGVLFSSLVGVFLACVACIIMTLLAVLAVVMIVSTGDKA